MLGMVLTVPSMNTINFFFFLNVGPAMIHPTPSHSLPTNKLAQIRI